MKKLLLGVFISAFIIACNDEKKEEKPAASEPAASTETQKTGDELLPASEGDLVRNALAAFSKGDVDGMTANYDDNVRMLWSSLDSLVGKKAVQDYFKGRWALIDSLSYSDHVILPVKMAVQQTPYAPVGKWILAWSFTHVKYKNGKKLDFWVHSANHVNDAGKIDVIAQYIDRAPINAATKGMKK